MDQQIEKLVQRYPEIRILRTAPGIGPMIGGLRTHPRPGRGGSQQPWGRSISGTAAQAESIGRLQSGAPHHQDGQYLPADIVGASGPSRFGTVRSGFCTAALGTEAGNFGRQSRQKAGDHSGGAQAGSDFALHVANRTGLSTFPKAGICGGSYRLRPFKKEL